MGRLITNLGAFDPAKDVRREHPGMPQTERRGGLDVALDPRLAEMGIQPDDITLDEKTGLYVSNAEDDKGVPRDKASSITRADEKVTRYLVLSGLEQNTQILTMLPRLLNSDLRYDAIICFGGLGQETDQLGLLLTFLANNPKKRPVYALPGNIETMDVWEKAVEGAREQVKTDNLFNMVAYDPRVRSDNHTLLFIPGSSKPYVRNGYVVVSDSEPKTQTIKRKEEGTRTRILNLDEYLSGVDMERASRYIVVCADMPKLEGEQAIDYEEVITLKDKSGVVTHPSISAVYKKRAEELGYVVSEVRKENNGNEKLAEALRKSCISHVLCAGIPPTSQKSCDNEGKAVREDYAERRYHNATGLNEGWSSMLEVVETPEQCDENARKMPADYGLRTRVTPIHIMHTMR